MCTKFVRCTTQASFISCAAASQAGVAAVAGEQAKDDHYLETISDHGGEFIPQVCESFGVWTPFVLSTLFIITDRTAIQSGAYRKLAWKQLIERLSVTLWKYMIMRHYALRPEDSLSFVVQVVS